VRWVNPDGGDRSSDHWDFGHAFGMLLCRRVSLHQERSILVVFNAWHQSLEFRLPETEAAQGWQLEFCSAEENLAASGAIRNIPGRSIAVFKNCGASERSN